MGQLLVEGGESERNLERAAEMAEEAAQQGCDILLLPECLDLGWTHPTALTEAEPIPGPRSDFMCELAKEHGLFICCGLTEKDGDAQYNSAVLIDDTGNILLQYRKINVLDVGFEFYGVGQKLSVVDTKFGCIGVNICSDNYADAPDLGYALGRMGAQIILSPSSWTVDHSVTECDNPYGEKWVKPYSRLASTFNLVIANATSVGVILGGPYEGMKSVGCSICVGPEGVVNQGQYVEFAGELVVAEFDVPTPKAKGTNIGKMLTEEKKLVI